MKLDIAGFALQKHQAEAVDWLRTHPRALLAHDTGLGKTVTAIAHVCEVLEDTIRAGRMPGLIIWVTEANLLAQTKNEFARFAPRVRVLSSTDLAYRSQSDRARTELRDGFGATGPHVLLMSYDTRYDADILRRRFRRPMLVVCDEVQAIKGGKAHFHRVLELTKSSPRVLAMTATPMQKNVMELWHVLAVLHIPDLLPKNQFGRRYATWSEAYQPDKLGKPWVWVEAKPNGLVEENVDELRTFVRQHMHRVTVCDAEAHTPAWAPDSGPRWIQLSQPQTAAYAASGGGGVGYVRRTQTSRVHAGVSPLVDEFLRLIGPGGDYATEPKVIVACGTLDVVALLGESLNAAGIGHRLIEGKTTSKARTRAICSFWDNPDVRVLVGSDVLETGLNLQCARLLISLDCSENPMRERQREGRIRRIGSPHRWVTHVTLMPDTPQARRKWNRLAAEERDARLVLNPDDRV